MTEYAVVSRKPKVNHANIADESVASVVLGHIVQVETRAGDLRPEEGIP